MRGFGRLLVCGGLLAASPAWPAMKMRVVEGHPIVDGVYVNGHGPYSFLIDTGTTANHLDRKVARAIGLKATFRSQLISSGGAIYVPGTDGIEVQVGEVRADRQRFLLAGVEVIRQFEPGVQGVLGQAFLSHFDYLLDLKGKRIEFGKREPAASEIRTPLRMAGQRPLVATSLGELVLDSGTQWVALFGVESSGARGDLVTMSGAQRVGTVVRKLLIEGRAFWSGQAVAVPQGEAGAQGLLPVSLFKTVYFCNSEGYVSLE